MLTSPSPRILCTLELDVGAQETGGGGGTGGVRSTSNTLLISAVWKVDPRHP